MAERSTETTSDVRFCTSGRPCASRIAPRTAGVTTSRMRFSDAAAWYS